MSRVVDSVKTAIIPVLESLGAELVDVEFEKKYGQDNLTIFIHIEGGVTLDECERVHLAIDPVLDEINPTGDSPYVLNVSSPGLDRPFKTMRDFERNLGKGVEAKLYAPLLGKKVYEGALLAHDENTTTICVKGKNGDGEIKIENTRIAFVRPLVKF